MAEENAQNQDMWYIFLAMAEENFVIGGYENSQNEDMWHILRYG